MKITWLCTAFLGIVWCLVGISVMLWHVRRRSTQKQCVERQQGLPWLRHVMALSLEEPTVRTPFMVDGAAIDPGQRILVWPLARTHLEPSLWTRHPKRGWTCLTREWQSWVVGTRIHVLHGSRFGGTALCLNAARNLVPWRASLWPRGSHIPSSQGVVWQYHKQDEILRGLTLPDLLLRYSSSSDAAAAAGAEHTTDASSPRTNGNSVQQSQQDSTMRVPLPLLTPLSSSPTSPGDDPNHKPQAYESDGQLGRHLEWAK